MGLLTFSFVVCPLVPGRDLNPGLLQSRFGPQAGPPLHRVRVRTRVVPIALQPFNAAFQGHGLTFPVRSSTVKAHSPDLTIQVPALM
jgi:hypothetical protein